MDEIIVTQDLCKTYRGRKVVDGVNLHVKQGEIYGFVGQNGAGKSTLAKLICGFEQPLSGSISMEGRDLKGDTIKERAARIGYVMQNPNQMISKPMIWDEVEMALVQSGMPKEERTARVEETLRICGLYPFRNWPVSALSFGQKKRVTIASILVQRPQVIILDEPTAGLDPKERVRFRNLIEQLGKDRIVLLSTQIVSDIEHIAGQVLMMKDGRMIYQGHWDEEMGDLEEFYLQQFAEEGGERSAEE